VSQKKNIGKNWNLIEGASFYTHHGQLYVAANRVPSFNGLRFYIFEYNGQGHLANDERAFTKNIICTEEEKNTKHVFFI
jgi:hypothetical protein